MTTLPTHVSTSQVHPPLAPTIWESVLDGRYRIVDWYDRDGRRYLVTEPSADRSVPPVTARQRRMLTRRAQGAAIKVIAFELGLSLGTVSRDITLAMSRLGLQSSTDLAAVLGHVGA